MEETKDLKEALENYDIEILEEIRTLNLVGEVNEDMVMQTYNFIDSLSELESDITINISSEGGAIHCMMAIMDTLKQVKGKITTIANGYVWSAALPIYLLGDIRKCGSKNTRFMYHKIAWGHDGVYPSHKLMLHQSEELQQQYDELITSRCDISQKVLDEIQYEDYYFTRDKAVEFGIVNNID